MLEFLIPLHPKMVHFPVALFIVALGFEALSWITKKEGFHRTAWHLYVAAALITPLVVRTGIWEVQRVQLNHPVLDTHKRFALYAMWTSLMSIPVLWALRREYGAYFRPVFVVLLLVVAVFIGITGHKGGEMVFGYGVGIEE